LLYHLFIKYEQTHRVANNLGVLANVMLHVSNLVWHELYCLSIKFLHNKYVEWVTIRDVE